MAALKDRLRQELTASMKARDELRSSTIRMVLTALTHAEVSGKQARELSDEDVTSVLATERKKRREAAEAFDAGGRPKLADKERAEAEVISEFLPEPLTEAQISSLVADTIAELGVQADGMRAMGKVMGALAPRTNGRADGGTVSAEVRRQLA